MPSLSRRQRALLEMLSAYLSRRFGELAGERAAEFSNAIQICPDCEQRCPGITLCYYLPPQLREDALPWTAAGDLVQIEASGSSPSSSEAR